MSDIHGATVDSGKSFWNGAGGLWAGQQMLRAMTAGKQLTTDCLRTLDTLRKDEWTVFDESLVEEGVIRLRGVADLMAAGLVRRVANGMGKTIYEWEKVTDMAPAIVSLSGMVESENDRVEFDLAALPLPITHKDFFLDLRVLTASRTRGESLDTTQSRVSGRLVAEKTESMLFNGASKNYRGLPIYGYTTHPDRNTISYGTGGAWSGSKTGEQIVTDILSLKAAAEADRMFGPYVIYVSSVTNLFLDNDFKSNSDLTIRQRLMQVDQVTAIRSSDQLAAGNVVMVQMTPDVVVMVEGERLQTIQWDVQGGFGIRFKAFQILVPLIRSDAQGRSGIVHMS